MKTTKEVMEQQAKIIKELRKDLTSEEILTNQHAVVRSFLLKLHQPPKDAVYH